MGAHEALTAWIKENPAEARELVKAELKELTTKAPSDALLDRSLPRVVLSTDVSRPALDVMVESAKKAGFLHDIPELDALLPKL